MTPGARIQSAIELLDAIIAAARDGGAAADTIVARWFAARRPQVQARLGVVDAETRLLQRRTQYRATGGVTPSLLGQCLIVGQRGPHGLLHRPRHDHPGVFDFRPEF